MTPQELLDTLNWRYATKEFDFTVMAQEGLGDLIGGRILLQPGRFGFQCFGIHIVLFLKEGIGLVVKLDHRQ